MRHINGALYTNAVYSVAVGGAKKTWVHTTQPPSGVQGHERCQMPRRPVGLVSRPPTAR